MDNQTADNQVLQELVDCHYAVLYRYAFRLTGNTADAEDITQQTFLTAQRKLNQLRNPESSRGWLFAIARNIFLRSLRDQPSAPHLSLESVGELSTDLPAEGSVDSERLQAVLQELPEEFRTPLILYYFKEFSYKGIARQMDLPLGTVMSRLARGKAFLRRRLGTESIGASAEAASHANTVPGSERERSRRT